jgi:enterochelin esterase family protein
MIMTVIEQTLTLPSAHLGREVTLTLLKPEGAMPVSLLLLNDGQELENLRLKEALEDQYSRSGIDALLVVAIHAGEERLQEYGVAGHPDFKQRGAKAELYTKFITEELIPFLEQQTGQEHYRAKAIAGCSLGGLCALDIAWNHADLFNKAGAFSGSFWWRERDLADGYTDGHRIMHRVIRNSDAKPAVKFWLQTGTKDEVADRNHNGIIDSIDDAIDLIAELEKKGYTRPEDIQYLEMVGGEHNTATWAKAMPKFLCWAFGS